MAQNAILTPSIISKETLVILENNLVAAAKVNRQFENQFRGIGSTITVRKPNRFVVTQGPGLAIQDVQEPSTSLTVSEQNHVDFQFTDQDLTLVIDEFAERYLKPAAVQLANRLDQDVLANYVNFNNLVGTPGTIPNSFASLAAVGNRMDHGAVPQDGRTLVLGSDAYWTLAAGMTGFFVTSVSESALKGFLANIANFEIYLDQNIGIQTVGNYGGTPVVNGAGQNGATLVTNGWTASVSGLLNVGDVITLAGVYAVNPRNLMSTGQLANFVVTAPVNSDSGGNATISIYPAITTEGPYQTVTGSPANLAPITVSGAANTQYAQNLAFVRDAIGLVVVPLQLPEGVDFGAREMYKNLSLRIVRFYDGQNDVFPTRIDLLYGTSTFYPELGVRLTN